MTRPWRILYAGAKYHVTVRGNARQEVFHEERDYLRFIEQLSDGLEKDEIILYAFVLMPNHYHLFVETKHGNIQRFMQRLNTAYSMYHRYKHNQPGHCFQGRYGAKLVKGDDYILRLTRYVHLNPVKVAAFKEKKVEVKISELDAFRWSSYRGYIGLPVGFDLKVDHRWLKMMNRSSEKRNKASYRKYVESCVSRTDDEIVQALELSRYAVGRPKFIDQIEDELREVKVNKGVYGDIKWPEGKILKLDDISGLVAGEFSIKETDLAGLSLNARLAKKVALEIGCRYSGLSERKVGEYFGYRGNGAVGKQRGRLKKLLDVDDRLKKRMDMIIKRLLNA